MSGKLSYFLCTEVLLDGAQALGGELTYFRVLHDRLPGRLVASSVAPDESDTLPGLSSWKLSGPIPYYDISRRCVLW